MEKRSIINYAIVLLLCVLSNAALAGTGMGDNSNYIGVVDILATTDETCAGDSDGSINFRIRNLFSGGVSATTIELTLSNDQNTYSTQMSFAVSGGEVTDTFSGLPEGTYTLQGTADSGDFAFKNNIVINSGSATISLTFTEPSCNGGADGSITVNASGGVSPYEYSLNNGRFQTSNQFLGLTSGSYQIQVRGGNGCLRSVTVEVTQPDALTASLVGSDALCSGASSGSVQVTATGGTAPYEYSIDGGTTFVTTSEFTGLTAGNYGIITRDSNNCTVTENITISEAAPVVASVQSFTDVTCHGGSDGTVTFNITGGTGPYSAHASNTTTGGSFIRVLNTGNVLTGVEPGVWEITIRDANFCPNGTTMTVTMTDPDLFELDAILGNKQVCNGGTTSLTVNVRGGDGPYTYSNDGGTTFQTSATFDNLVAGVTYDFQAKDARGCTATPYFTTTTFQLTELDPITATITAQDVSCFGAMDGTIDASGTTGGAGGGYQYSIDGTNFQTSGNFTGLAAGSYTVDIKDGFNCTATLNVVIAEPAEVTATANVLTQVLCFGGDEGSVEILTNTPPAPVMYSINGGTPQVGNTFSGLIAGNYTADVISGANACISSTTFTITEPSSGLAVTATHADISCNGAADGNFELVITGGTAPYEASNDGTNFTAISPIQSFPVGTETIFDIVVRDANGCVFTVPTFTVNEPDLITATFTELAPCTEDTNGQIIVAASGGTAPYMYRLGSTGSFQSSDTFSGLSAGPQTIEIQDTNGCTGSFTATVPTGTPIIATLGATGTSCAGDSDGTVTVSAVSGGTAPYTYSIDGINFQSTQVFSGLSAGMYTATITDANGCSITETTTVTEPPLLSVIVSNVADATCSDASDGAVTFEITGGTAPYEYTDIFRPAPGFEALAGTTVTFTDMPAGVRDGSNAAIRDANGCFFGLTFTINSPPALSLVVDSRTNISCNGAADGSVTFLASGGSAPYEYSLNGTDYQASNVFQNLTVLGSRTGYVRDANGCISTSASFPVFEPNPVNASVTVDADLTNCANPDGALTVSASGHFNATTYEYSIDGGGTFQSSGSFTGLSAGTYNIVVRTSVGTCEVNLTATIADVPGITGDAITTNTTSCGVADGTITVTNVMNGTGPYTYSLGGGTPQSNPVFTGLAAGTYFVFINDANLCDGDFIVATVSEPSGITADLDIVSLTCPDELTGSITLNNVAGGTAPYEYSFDGGATYSTSNSVSGLDSDIYEVIVRDAGNCRLVLSADVTGPPTFNWSRVVQNVTCNGGSDGEISVTATGGTGTLRYSLDGTNFQTSSLFSGLTAGGYTVYVTDDNNCNLAEINASVSEPPAINASVTATTNVTCNGGNDGTATIAVSGGTAPYEVSIDGTQYFPLPPGGMFTNIGAIDIPTILVRDANGCAVSINGFVITEPTPIELEAIAEAVSCFGDSDGAINVSASSDSGNPFEYSIDGNNFITTNRFDQLSPGMYTITARETITLCTTTTQVTVAEPDMLNLNASAIDVTCNGADNGQIRVEATGGTAPYEYSLDGTNFQTTDFTGLAPGSYTVTVRDSEQCTDNRTYNIAEPTVLTASFTTIDAVCHGEANGSVTLDISGGTAPYSWSDPLTFDDGAQAITGNTATFDAIGGTRTNQAAVIDANGCEFTIDFVINEPDAIVGTTSGISDVTCYGASDGAFTVIATGGTGLYTYAIDGTNFTATNSFSGLAAGTYTVSIQDESNCIATVTQIISEPMVLTLQYESVDITCHGAMDGQIAGITTGGTAPYTYSIDGSNFQSTAFSGLSAGSYVLTVRDANDCEATTTVDILEPAILTSAITSTSPVDCNGNSTGSAVLDVTGGSTPYNYSLDGSSFNTSIDLSNLNAGNYTVTVRDANSCESTASFTITEPDVLGISLGTVNDVSCYSGTDGSISAVATGGTAPYEYAIDGVTFGSADTFGNLTAGSYTLTVLDANGCTAMVSAIIDEPAAIALNFTTTNVTCNGESNGEIIPAATGGTGPYEYSLDGTNFQSGAFSGRPAGTYTLTVRDANGCTETSSVTLTEPVALTGSVAISNIDCFGAANGSINITTAGGTAPYEHSTDGSTFQTGGSFTNLAAGNYTVTIRDANNCSITVPATVTEPAELTVSATVINDNTISVTASGGTAPYEYALDNGNFQSAGNFSGLANGDYSITVRDGNGCTVTSTGSLVITGTDEPFTPVSVSAYPNPVSDYLTFSRLESGDQVRLISLDGNSLDHVIITEAKDEFRKDISGIRQKVFLAIVVSKDGRIKLNQKVMKEE